MGISDDYHIWYEENRIWETTKWLGVPIWKLPNDMLIMQELITNVRPDFLIETGTAHGGSAVFYASIFQLLDHGKVITVDIESNKHNWNWYNTSENVLSRIKFIIGSSIDIKTIEIVNSIVGNKKCLVVLDSWHSYDHVLEEMRLYSHFVSTGSYLIVEDTHINNPIKWKYGKGPYEAVEDFLKIDNSFEVDKNCERLGCTFNPGGYLLKKENDK